MALFQLLIIIVSDFLCRSTCLGTPEACTRLELKEAQGFSMTPSRLPESSGILLAGPMLLLSPGLFHNVKADLHAVTHQHHLQIVVCQPCHESCFLQLSFFLKTEMLDILEGAGGRLRYFFPIRQSVALCAGVGGCGGQGE